MWRTVEWFMRKTEWTFALMLFKLLRKQPWEYTMWHNKCCVTLGKSECETAKKIAWVENNSGYAFPLRFLHNSLEITTNLDGFGLGFKLLGINESNYEISIHHRTSIMIHRRQLWLHSSMRSSSSIHANVSSCLLKCRFEFVSTQGHSSILSFHFSISVLQIPRSVTEETVWPALTFQKLV